MTISKRKRRGFAGIARHIRLWILLILFIILTTGCEIPLLGGLVNLLLTLALVILSVLFGWILSRKRLSEMEEQNVYLIIKMIEMVRLSKMFELLSKNKRKGE